MTRVTRASGPVHRVADVIGLGAVRPHRSRIIVRKGGRVIDDRRRIIGRAGAVHRIGALIAAVGNVMVWRGGGFAP